jgi:hypothetical protein
MPESPTALAIRDKVEAVAQAWLLAKKPAGVVWDKVSIVRRKEIIDRVFPRVVFDATRAPMQEDVDGLYMVELAIYIGTKGGEVKDGIVPGSENDPAVRHTQRVGLITEIFGFGMKEDFIAFANPPASGPDERTVKGIFVSDTYVEDEDGEQTETAWMDMVQLQVVASLRDE